MSRNTTSVEPFIVAFKTKRGNSYIYDVTTNSIFSGSELTVDILNHLKKIKESDLIEFLSNKYSKTDVISELKKVKNWVYHENAFFRTNGFKIATMLPEIEFNERFVNCSHMIMVPTNQCNLRCKYCAYSGEYEENRTHNDMIMSLEIARKSIDYYISLLKSNIRTSRKNRGTIGFYGGEALLQFPLIKKCMEYVKSINCDDLVFWNITTNGTLLTREKINYFMKWENIKFSISLDGDQEDHDRHRIFPNGKGSFIQIMNNLRRINKINPEFYHKHIHFQPLLPRYNNPINLVDFFTSDPVVKDNEISSQIGDITPGAKHFYDDLTEEKNETFQKRYNKLFIQHLNMLISGDVNSRKFQILLALTGNILQRFDRRSYRPLHNLNFSTGTCIPGTRKFYVAPDGTFHICERVSQHHPIGDCCNGIDYQKCKQVFNNYMKNITTQCHKCPNIHFCSLCFAPADKGTHFETSNYCLEQQKTLKAKLSDYYSILEENPQAFELIGKGKES